MMVRLFKRVAEAFDADIARVRMCGSSGSEHSPESFPELSELVNSFIESDDGNELVNEGDNVEDKKESKEEDIERFLLSNCEILKGLLGCSNCSNGHGKGENEDVKQMILAEIKAFEGDISSKEFKRQLMIHLREKGFDAGLCKSRWEKSRSMPSGKYEYVDVYVNGDRYIVEVFLAREFHIARPTAGYTLLLSIFPEIFVSKPDELKQVVKIMCHCMKRLLDTSGLKMAPWRRNKYMQAKWFGFYKRTTNAISNKRNMASYEAFPAASARRLVGFKAIPIATSTIFCREDFACLMDKAAELFTEMEKSGCMPDDGTYNLIIRGFIKTKQLTRVKAYMKELADRNLELHASTIFPLLNLFIGNQLDLESYMLFKKLINQNMERMQVCFLL